MKFEQKEIVLIPFPYSDLSHIKKRPVLVISNNIYNDKSEDILVMAITSKNFLDEYSVEIDNSGLEFGLLPEASIIKVSKVFTIHKEKVIKKFSKINNYIFAQVISKLNNLLK